MKTFIGIGLCLLTAAWAPADEVAITGKVIRVSSGDRITILDIQDRELIEQEYVGLWGVGEEVDLDPPPEKVARIIHLAGIDAPESNQPYGLAARHALAEKVLGKMVRVTYWERDQFNHIVGDVYRGYDWINGDLISAGLAWYDKRYSDDDALDTLQQEAQKKRLGLWADTHPMPPWEWRQQHQAGTASYTEPAADTSAAAGTNHAPIHAGEK